ncbi:uncharacterized protein [Triticum aestivum]|uniref:uncharacterized protein isoform X2 n=1 Tax=Triticum aestivum TaxID=4565 RepID=UPI001D004FEB|nr:uncharacterized protein LOC123065925 isoform X2 [Triticum aestivum]
MSTVGGDPGGSAPSPTPAAPASRQPLLFRSKGAAAEQERATLAAAPRHPRRRRPTPHPPLLFGSVGAAPEQGRVTLSAASRPPWHRNRR